MKMFGKAALAAVALSLLPFAAAAPASARERAVVGFDFGNVAFGFRDGYWDQGHRWHRWHNRRDAVGYRTQYGDHYRDMSHNRARNHGWQDR
jgi:hypothetical protein